MLERYRAFDEYETKLKGLERKKARLYELRKDGSYSAEEFKDRKEKIELEIQTLSISKHETNIDRMEIEILLTKATEFLTNLGTHWKSQPAHIQRRFQQLVYPEGTQYLGEKGFGTAKLGLIFELNQRFTTRKSTLVDRAYKTLNSLKEYLAEFWGYYQYSSKLREVLEKISPEPPTQLSSNDTGNK